MGTKEYAKIFGNTIESELKNLGFTSEQQIEEMKQVIKENIHNKASIHFGQPYLNSATLAGLYRIALKDIAQKLNKTLLPIKINYRWWFDD